MNSLIDCSRFWNWLAVAVLTLLVDLPSPVFALNRDLGLDTIPALDDAIELAQDRLGNLLPQLPQEGEVGLEELPFLWEILEEAAQEFEDEGIDVAVVESQGFMVNDCLGIRGSAGQFALKLSRPTFQMTPNGVEFDFVIDRVSIQAISVQVMPSLPPLVESSLDFRIALPRLEDFNPCQWSDPFQIGGSAEDIHITMRFTPSVSLTDCTVVSLGNLDVDVSVGAVELEPLDVGLDESLRDLMSASIRTALTMNLSTIASNAMSSAVFTAICASRFPLYQLYMANLGDGVTLHSLPEEYLSKLQPLYPNVDLSTVRFGFSDRQPENNATTDCDTTYYNNADMVRWLRRAELSPWDTDPWYWLFHELRHTEQCVEFGGRQEYATTWFDSLGTSVLVSNVDNPDYFGDLHDNMPMEEDAEARANDIVIVTGKVWEAEVDLSDLVPGVEVTVRPSDLDLAVIDSFAIGQPILGTNVNRRIGVLAPPAASATSDDAGEYFLFLKPGSYDFYVRAPGEDTPTRVVAATPISATDADGSGRNDVHVQELSLPAPQTVDPIVVDPQLPAQPDALFVRGDVDDSDAVDVSDAVAIVAWLFAGAEEPRCVKSADTNDDGNVDISDSIGLLFFLFRGGPPPPPPFDAPGVDPTADDLPCV